MDSARPTGTVTFLFTDIEGSTKLVHALGAQGFAPLLERHRAILRAAIARNGGVEVGTEGDGFFAVFARAAGGIAAAAEAQKGLAAEAWPANAPIKVRMGLHTGEGHLDADGSYIGIDVHRAARIAAAAHGGQVILSDPTRALVSHSLPQGVALIDLGDHRLKDLRPERLAQLRIDPLPCEFPPVRSLDQRPNNLPSQLTSFVGRESEIAEAADYLKDTRLLTLSGPGGTGKTRLALQVAAAVAERFPDGVWFVALEPIRDPRLVAPTIARVLGIANSGDKPEVELIAEAVGSKRVLMVLDNFEQVIAAAPVTSQLLRACPELRLIVTSRAPLRVSGEQEFPIHGLPAPPDTTRLSNLELENLPAEARHPSVEALSQYEAVRLFIARASAVKPGFAVTNDNAPAVAQICARLHGMPLAIELTAARAKLLTPAQILSRLEKQLGLLTSGSRDLPQRQQTLRAAIAWSYDLLEDPAKELIDRLSVFSGGLDIAAAEAVCGADELGIDILDGLQALVDQSLLRREESGDDIRFDMFPTIQEFAAERLGVRGRSNALAGRHAEYYTKLAEEAAALLSGADQRVWLDRLERDHDNLRRALDWATANAEGDLGGRLGFSLWRFWQKRGYLNEARDRLTALEEKACPADPRIRARVHEALGGVAYWRADHASILKWYDRALTAWREIGDKREIANALYNRAYVDLLPLLQGGVSGPEAVAAREKCEEALQLFRETGDRPGEGNILWALGCFDYFANRPADAVPYFEQAHEVFRATGGTTMQAWTDHMLGVSTLRLGRLEEAFAYCRSALRHFKEAGDLSGVTLLLDDLSGIAVAAGDKPRAGRLRGAARQLQSTTGTGLAQFVEELFEARTRTSARDAMSPEELARYAAEGAKMSLDAVTDYALEDPFKRA